MFRIVNKFLSSQTETVFFRDVERLAISGLGLEIDEGYLTQDIFDEDIYYSMEIEDYFETDFWTMSIDSLEVDESYTEDLAYFLLDEGDLWEAVDLLNEIKMEEEISL